MSLFKIVFTLFIFAFTSCSDEYDQEFDISTPEIQEVTSANVPEANNAAEEMTTVANIAELIALTPIEGMRVNVSTYSKENDGGGGIFKYDETQSDINNGGTIIDGWVRLTNNNTVNLTWFGAVANDATNDQPAFKAAMDFCWDNSGYNLLIQSGTFNIEGTDNYFGNEAGWVREGSGHHFTLMGEDNSKLTSAQLGNANWAFIYVIGDNTISLDNIHFESTHALTTTGTAGIHYQSTLKVKDARITNCKFTGIGQPIVAHGTKNLLIENNYFYAPDGHDDSNNNSSPAVFIYAISRDTGENEDILVRNNWAWAYTGTDLTTTTSKKAMDGFYYGNSNGAIVENNHLYNFSEESIAILSSQEFVSEVDLRPIIIRGNVIDGTFPTGTKHDTNYGILADSGNINIYENTIKAAYGIIVNPVNEANQSKNISIHHNKIHLTDDTVTLLRGIYLFGYSTNELYPLANVSVHNNDIYATNLTLSATIILIQTGDIVNATIIDNNFFIENVTLGVFDLDIYGFSQNSDNIQYGREAIVGSYSNLVVSEGTNTGITYIGVSD